MALIDIGSAAVEGDDYWDFGNIWINSANSSNGTGEITSIEIYSHVAMTGCDVATFYRPDPINFPNKFTTRDWITIGDVALGYNQFDISLNVVEGDFIGIRFADGYIKSTVTVDTIWMVTRDNIICDNISFSADLTGLLSLYGTGETVEEPTHNFFGGYNNS
jgi:hypothetical protein